MSDLTLAIKLTTSGGKIVVQEIGDIAKASKGAADGLTDVGRAGVNAKSGLDQAGDSMARVKAHGHQMAVQAGVLYAALQLIGGFKGIIKQADDWGQYAARIRTATQDAAEYDYVQQRMQRSANETFRAINETKESFIQMSPILRDMGYQLNQSIDIVDSFSSLLVINAASSDKAAAAQAALAGSIQRGKVDADAWKTIFGTMPTVLDNLTAATGKTGAEIRQLGITGKLGITDLTNALLLSYEQNRQAVADMPTTVADALQSFNTVWSEYIGKQNEALGVTAKMADGIVFLAENFDVLVAVAGGAAVGVMTKYALSAAAATKAIYSKTMAVRAATAQELLLAKAQVAQTQASLQQATTMAGVTGTHARLAAATEGHRQAVLRLTAAQQTNATIGRMLLGVLGGPAGIAITAGIAATSLFMFRDSTDKAAKGTRVLYDETEQLIAAMEKMTANQAQKYIQDMEPEYKKATTEARLYSAQIETLNRNIEMHPGNHQIDEWRKSLVDAKGNLDTANQTLTKYNEQQRILNEHIEKNKVGNPNKPGNLPTEENKELEKALLGVYNAQMLAASAVDTYGAALTGIDLELFKTQFIAAEKLPADATEAIKIFATEAKAAAANLNLDNYLKQLQQEAGLLTARLGLTEKEYEIQKALAAFAGVEFEGADPARLAAIEAELRLMQKKQELAADQTTLAALTKENDLLMVRLAQGEKEYEIQKALAQLKGQDPAVLAAIEAELRLRQQLTEQISISENITSGAFSQALDDMTALSSAGQQFGDALTQAFGRVAQQIDGMTASQLSYNRQLDELAKKKKEAEKLSLNDPKRAQELLNIQRTETRLSREHFQSQIGQYAALSGAAAQMFGEQSKEREKLHKLEQAFSAIEMALALERAAASALAAIANQGSGDPYTAFARIAAMAALMAGLGLFSGSVSSSANLAADRQASQGTGTVLGDSEAKSASISNALDRIADLSLDQYVELRSINSSIKTLNAGIANLAVSLVTNTRITGKGIELENSNFLDTELGGFLRKVDPVARIMDVIGLGGLADSIFGGFSKTTQKLLDSGISFEAQKLGEILATGLVDAALYNTIETTKRKAWGLSKKRRTATEYTDLDDDITGEFARIFGYLGSSINAAVDVLALDITRSLDNFVINLPNISFKDLSGDEIAKELEAVFSQQADLMAKYLIPGIAEYQKMGEGLYDTLIRVAQEQAIFNAQLDALGLQLGDVSAALRIDVAQSIVELMGGIEAFRDATSEYFSAFYSESEQFDYLSKTISNAFASLGLSVPATREQFRGVVDALDLTTDAGQQLFAQLMQLVPGLDEYFKALDKQADALEEAAEAAKKAADAEKALAAERKQYTADRLHELLRMDWSPLKIAIDDITQWHKKAVAEAKELGADTGLLDMIYDKKRQQLAEQTLQAAIKTAETAMQQLVNGFERDAAALKNVLQQFEQSIASFTSQVAADVLNLQKTLPSFDAVGYYDNLVNQLTGQLGGRKTAAEQLDIVTKLRAAINDRYSAELGYLEQQNALQLEQYNLSMDTYRALQQAAESMRDAAASLLITDMSPLTAGQRLAEAQSQFDAALALARAGDAAAYGDVQSLGQQILQLSKDYNPADYSDVFGDIKAIFDELGGFAGAEPTEPAPHPAIVEYEAQKIALAERTISELLALQTTAAGLKPLAEAEFDTGIAVLKATFAQESAKITAAFEASLAELRLLLPNETTRLLILQQKNIEAIYELRDGVLDAIYNIPTPDLSQLKPTVNIDLGKLVEKIIVEPVIKLPVQPVPQPDIIVLPPDFSPMVEQLTAINQGVRAPAFIPPPVVNVDTSPIVAELRAVQQKQQQQIAQQQQQQAALQQQMEQQRQFAAQQIQQLQAVVDSNKKATKELVDLSADLLQQRRSIA